MDEELDTVKADTPKSAAENATPDPDAEEVVKEETKESESSQKSKEWAKSSNLKDERNLEGLTFWSTNFESNFRFFIL